MSTVMVTSAGRSYSEGGFWKKAGRCAKAAGSSVLLTALKLFYPSKKLYQRPLGEAVLVMKPATMTASSWSSGAGCAWIIAATISRSSVARAWGRTVAIIGQSSHRKFPISLTLLRGGCSGRFPGGVSVHAKYDNRR